MPDPGVLAVVVLAVAGQHSLHDAANRIVLHLDQKMNVVGHQTVSIEIEGQLQFLLLKNAGEPDVVVVRVEYLSAIIPTSNDVIEPSHDFDTRLRGMMEQMLPLRRRNMSRNSSLTPPDALETGGGLESLPGRSSLKSNRLSFSRRAVRSNGKYLGKYSKCIRDTFNQRVFCRSE